MARSEKMTKMHRNRAYFVSVMDKISTVHGTNQFALKKGNALYMWCMVVMANMALTGLFIVIVKQKFVENQIVTQINANCKVNQVPFPAVSICNFNMVSQAESGRIAGLLKHYKKTDVEIHSFFNALTFLKNSSVRSNLLGNFTDIIRILKHHYFILDTIMEEVHQKCESLLQYCSFNRKQKDCSNIFSLIKTYEGHCCAFNYAALNDPNEVLQSQRDEDMEYYDDGNSDSGYQTSGIIATSEFGKMSGLSVLLNVEPGDYADWSIVPYFGSKILITDPDDYPEITLIYRYLTLGESLDIKIEPMILQSENEVRRLDLKRRNCAFNDEIPLTHTDRYSYETCITECKMNTYLETCGCIPYKYPREKSTRICEFENLDCIHNVTVNQSREEMYCDPVCFIECRDQLYKATSDIVPLLPEFFPDDVMKDRNTSELSALHVYFSKSHCNCYKLTLLIDINYFIATYGGVFSLSFGGSLLTLFELMYLFLTFVITTAVKSVSRLHG